MRYSCRITSYINNLHPQENKALYAEIEKIIAKAIVLWNQALSPLRGYYFSTTERIPFKCPEYEDLEDFFGEDRPMQVTGESDEDYERRLTEMALALPEPGEFVEPPTPTILAPPKALDLREEYSGKGLQVIVKLANIHLTPEKPEYRGGIWHVEGHLVSIRLA